MLITYSSSRGETSASSNQFKLRNTLKRSSPKEGAEPAPMLNLKQIFLPPSSCLLLSPFFLGSFPKSPSRNEGRGPQTLCVQHPGAKGHPFRCGQRGHHPAPPAPAAREQPGCTHCTRPPAAQRGGKHVTELQLPLPAGAINYSQGRVIMAALGSPAPPGVILLGSGDEHCSPHRHEHCRNLSSIPAGAN